MFVTLGATKKRGYSTDGINWTVNGALGNLHDSPTGVDYNPTADLLVAGGGVEVAGEPSYATGSSYDTWTAASASGMSLAVRMICYSPDLDLWIAGSENGEIASSSDADTWTNRKTGLGFVRAGAWSPSLGLFVAGHTGTGAQIQTSPDGTTWTGRTNPGVNVQNRAAWSPSLGLFVITGRSTSTVPNVITSTDGITWTLRSLPAGFGTAMAWPVCWSEDLGVFVIGSFSGGIATSSDGVTWTNQTSTFGTDRVNGIAWSSDLGLFVAVGNAGKLATSPDGSTWTSRTSGFGTEPINEVIWVEPVLAGWTVGSIRSGSRSGWG